MYIKSEKNGSYNEKMSNIATKKLKLLRDYLDLSLVKFGQEVGVSATKVRTFETGNHSSRGYDEYIEAVCNAFDIDRIYFENEEITPESVITKPDNSLETAARLTQARTNKEWSMNELSRQSGVPDYQICRIEKGQRSLTKQTAIKLALALEIGVDWLMKGNEDRKKYPADQKMTDWLWKHPDIREKIWNMMKNEE